MFGFKRVKRRVVVKREEVKIEQVPNKVQYEITQQKDERTVIKKKGKIPKKREYVYWRKRAFFPNHIIKETYTNPKGKEKVRYIIRWNQNYAEAYDVDGKVKHSPELENHLMNDMVIQLRDAVGVVAGLLIDRNTQILLLFALVFGIPIGLAYNDIFHWVPNTVIHWVPRA